MMATHQGQEEGGMVTGCVQRIQQPPLGRRGIVAIIQRSYVILYRGSDGCRHRCSDLVPGARRSSTHNGATLACTNMV